MNNQIIIGWPDKSGQGLARIVLGLDSTEAQRAEVMNAANRQHVFPSGIQRIARANLEIVESAAFISEAVTAHLKSARDQAESLRLDREQKATATSAQDKLVKELAALERAAVLARNTLIAERAKRETQLRNFLATPEKLQAKNHKTELLRLQKEIQDLQPKINAAVEKFQAIQKAHEQASTGAITEMPDFQAESKAAAEKAAADALSATDQENQQPQS